jgi:capsular polysaccharide biosynthesis protein
MAAEEREIDLFKVFLILKKNWLPILIVSLMAAAITSFKTTKLPRTYESYALLKIGYVGAVPVEAIGDTAIIMESLTIRNQIIKDLAGLKGYESPESLSEVIKYEQLSNLLKVKAEARDPETAKKIVSSAVKIIVARQDKKYQAERAKLDALVKYIKETIRPVPLSSGINEFKFEPTEVEIEPMLINRPVLKANKKLPVMSAFLLGALVSSIFVIFLNRREL